jgi:hypothetical protein
MNVCLWHLLTKIVIPSFVIFSGGCGDITGPLASLTISPSNVTIGINKIQLFSADGKDSLGKIVSTTVTWSVEGNIGTIAASGLFTAGRVETTGNIVATAGSISSKTAVTITTRGWLEGRVSAPLEGNLQGVKVYLKENSLNNFSNSLGKYSIANIPAGTYEARTLETALYLATSTEVTIGSGETFVWNPSLTLKPGIPTIPTTTIPSIFP